VLHRPGGSWESTHRISDSIQVTTSRDVLAAMAKGEGPEDAFIALGYAQWEEGQLERELRDNTWLTLPVSDAVLFDLPYEDRWIAAWRSIGVDVTQVSPRAGNA
jgi:putative transcriptional regulator